jgi:cyclic pyranopterin phosphate synthase
MSHSVFSHIDDSGAARMVDISGKEVSERLARASARVWMQTSTAAAIRDHRLAKGAVLEVARVAGIMAAKKTAELIPLCHPLAPTAIAVDFLWETERTLRIEATVRICDRTGVEMEALTAVSVAALTVYDMCKSVDRDLVITDIRLEEKRGGRSGAYRRDAPSSPTAGSS